MIKIVHKQFLLGSDKFGDCLSCGDSEDIYKITFSKDDNRQQNSIRLCRECLKEFKEKLDNIKYE